MGNANKKKSKVNRSNRKALLHSKVESKNPIYVSSDSDLNLEVQKGSDLLGFQIVDKKNETEKLIFEEKEEEIKSHFNSDKEDSLSIFCNNQAHRSKSVCNNNINIFNAPIQKIKMFNEHISPLKLSTKTYGGSNWKSKKPNSIIFDYEKTTADSKSCNDNEYNTDDFFDEEDSDSDIEKTIPNAEDLKNLQNCRKKMAIFRDSLGNKSDHSLNEDEKIDFYFSEEKHKIKKQNKKKRFWSRHIKNQILKSKLSRKLTGIPNIPIKKSATVRNEKIKIKNNDLFILGVLESAAKEKKYKKLARYTSNV